MSEYATEVWKFTTVSRDYEVSTFGRVRSVDRVTPHGHNRRGKILSQSLAKSRGEYFVVAISVNGYQRPYYVHRLVAEAFLGPLPLGHHTRHGKGGKLDNRLSNLSYRTREQNEADKLVHGYRCNSGVHARGENNGNTRLTEQDVRNMRAAHQAGARQVDLAAQYGITQATVSQIILRRTWAWL